MTGSSRTCPTRSAPEHVCGRTLGAATAHVKDADSRVSAHVDNAESGCKRLLLLQTTRYAGAPFDMAFCPHCGTSIADQATDCSACGLAIGAVAAKPKGRFKGTMIAMGGGQTPAAAATQPMPKPPAPPPPLGTPAPGPPANDAAPLTAAAAQPGNAGQPKKKAGTMLGVGMPGSPAETAPAPETAVQEKSPAMGATAKSQPAKPGASAQAPSAGATPPGRALARTPQARSPGAIATAEGNARAPREGRFRAGSVPPPAPASLGPGKLLALGIGGIVLIAAAGYALALFLDLIH